MNTVYNVKYYETENGERPFQEWLDSLKDITGRAKVHIRIDRARLGNFGDTNSVGEGVHELKINYGPGYRIYYALDGKRLILLLFGGDKSKQSRDINQAKAYWKDQKRRKR
ncbi:MAG: type II toxin-antitoxin system RelE/ParE family toxin [Deltaproteobacteria bacterium]|nr:type II toxin-antitoxin system RelE/ParE family toxin [Deltaproteobacteria bacterium]